MSHGVTALSYPQEKAWDFLPPPDARDLLFWGDSLLGMAHETYRTTPRSVLWSHLSSLVKSGE